LDHIVVTVRNLGRATETYRMLLGREPSWRGRHPGGGTANTLFRLDNTYLELLAADGDGADAALVAGWLERYGEGPFALVFRTDDAASCAATLRQRDLAASEPVAGEGRDEASGAERRWRTLRLPLADTRGVPLVVIEHRSPAEALPPARPRGDAQAAIAACDHVVVTTTDADAARVLYGERLGLRLALDRTFPDWGARLLFFRIGSVTVELAARTTGDERGTTDGFWGISWRVPDLDACHARLGSAGFDVSAIRTGRRPGTRVATVRAETHGVATLVIGPA
jgi:catechol 2,3-dioxygenase-like lactoylglutathione lyase family enzyme